MAESSNRIPALDVCFTPIVRRSRNANRGLHLWKQAIQKDRNTKLISCVSTCLSPLDLFKCGKQKRAESLGWTGWKNCSFEGNQSFPRISSPKLLKEKTVIAESGTKMTMERIRGDGLNSCSFSSSRARGSFSLSRFTDAGNSRPLKTSSELNIRSLQGISDSAWSFSSSFVSAVGGSSINFPAAAMNPNKAVFTIDAKSSKILVVNGMACNLLGYTPEELCQMKLHQLLSGQHKLKVTALSEEQLDTKEGNMVVLSGKVVEMVAKDEKVLPVSLWLRKLETEGRCLAVAEPVERRAAQLVIDRAGCIMSADAETAVIFQFEEEELEGADIGMLIPAIKVPESDDILPKEIRKQKATGRTRDGATFPLCLRISEQMSDKKDVDNPNSMLYSVVVWVFANMSGLVVISDVGTIESCNHHFTHLMFGYPQSELLGQKITTIIPNFCDDLEYLGDTPVTLPPFDFNKTDDDNSNYDSALENTDQDKSRHSKKDAFESERPSLTMENIGVELLKKEENDVTDVVNANSAPAPVGEIVDSMNRLNLAYDKELSEGIPCESKPSSLSSNLSSTVSAYESIPSTLEGAANFRSVPPTTLNIVHSSIYFDTENGSDNGELTPIVSPRNDFVEYDDHFETASDGEDDDSIEVIQDDGEVPQTNNSNVSGLIVGPFSPENAPGNGKGMNVRVEVIHISSDSCGGCEESGVKLEKSFEGIEAVNKGGGDEMEKLVKSLRNIDNSEDLNVVAEPVDLIDEDRGKQLLDDALMTSTPAIGKRPARKRMSKDLEDKQDLGVEKKIVDGSYVGYGRHKDGSNLDIVYRVRGVVLSSGKKVFCVWTSRDPDEMGEGGRIGLGSLTLTSSFNSTVDNSLGQVIRSCAQSNVIAQPSTRHGSVSVQSQYDEDQTCGEYGEHYTTLQQIGKGAFGYVKMAYRKEDGLLVITKFIQKQKVHQQSWVDDPNLGRKVPLEISLLTTLKHPNIVQVLDVFENPKFFQLVMEKHGAGMDLFEFIDRKPYLDESLNSYIFRQIVSAVDYLHSLQILHRDIKDENVIINERFHAKLIDFGSATFMSEGRLFSTFYGTVEYCSPEVLAGNKYEGPELEMWSLGVTLYVMTFGENPYFDVEEIMRAEMHPPCKVSEELMELLQWMLAKDPRERCKVVQLINHQWVNQEVDMSSYSFQDVVSCHPQEAHPPVYYADYRCDSANDSLSLRFPITESSSAVLSNNEEDSNADDRTVGSSNSLGSLTTVENFETEEDTQGHGATEQKITRREDCTGNEHTPVASVIKTTLGKLTHSMEEELVDCTNQSPLVGEEKTIQPLSSGSAPAPATDDYFDDVWDSDYYYEEQDSFS